MEKALVHSAKEAAPVHLEVRAAQEMVPAAVEVEAQELVPAAVEVEVEAQELVPGVEVEAQELVPEVEVEVAVAPF